MSGRSPSGVASLRARFEQNADPESLTPSRGRSPAVSINSDTSRPLSKVRTSFISVGEPSGQMGDLLDGKEASRPTAVDGAEESKTKGPSKLDENAPTSAPRDTAGDAAKASEEKKTSESDMTMSAKPDETTATSSSTAADSGKPTTGGEVDAAAPQPAESKSKTPASGEVGAPQASSDLGSILKGSAFEEGEAKREAASQKPTPSGAPKSSGDAGEGRKTVAAPASMDTVKPPSSTGKALNGKPKESKTVQAKPQTKPQSEQSTGPKAHGASKPSAINDTSKQFGKADASAQAAPAAAGTSSNKEKAPIDTPTPSASISTTAAAASPKKESTPRKAESSKDSIKGPATGPKATTTLPDRKPNPPAEKSRSSNLKTTPSSAPTTSKPPAKKVSHPTSQPTSGTGFVKPKPRSPTRPVNLPSHLTAQTAASAAKHGDDTHAEPHKDQSAAKSKATGPRAPSHLPPPHHKAPRASMPAAGTSSAAEREKAKPRMSVAGGSGSGGSFLERMMRPTQSSAQKTADRTESGKNSPPRKASGSRNVSGSGPKTATGASTHKPDQHAHNDGGHGEGREKHGMSTNSGLDHGQGQEARGTARREDVVTNAAESKASAPQPEPASASDKENTVAAPGNTEERPTDQADAAATGSERGIQTE